MRGFDHLSDSEKGWLKCICAKLNLGGLSIIFSVDDYYFLPTGKHNVRFHYGKEALVVLEELKIGRLIVFTYFHISLICEVKFCVFVHTGTFQNQKISINGKNLQISHS